MVCEPIHDSHFTKPPDWSDGTWPITEYPMTVFQKTLPGGPEHMRKQFCPIAESIDGGLATFATSRTPDPQAIKFYKNWLQTYPHIFPKPEHLGALAILTEESLPNVEAWFAFKFRQANGFLHDQTSLPSSAPSLTFQSSHETSSEPVPRSSHPFADIIASDTFSSSISTFDDTSLPEHSLENHIPEVTSYFDQDSAEVNEPEDVASTIPGSKDAATHRHCLAMAASAASDRSNDLGKACVKTHRKQNLDRNPRRPWQCTRSCGKNYNNKKNWVRHETLAYPQKGWVCTVGESVSVNGRSICSYCPPGERAIHVDELHENSRNRCESGRKNARKGGFYRYQHFVQHFNNNHPALDPKDFAKQSYFTVKDSAFPRICGFCGEELRTWQKRLNHISDHFEHDGMNMHQWNRRKRSHIPSSEQPRNPREDDDDDDDHSWGSQSDSDADDDDHNHGGGASGSVSYTNPSFGTQQTSNSNTSFVQTWLETVPILGGYPRSLLDSESRLLSLYSSSAFVSIPSSTYESLIRAFLTTTSHQGIHIRRFLKTLIRKAKSPKGVMQLRSSTQPGPSPIDEDSQTQTQSANTFPSESLLPKEQDRPQWVWDHHRSEYYYYNSLGDNWVYQSGKVVSAALGDHMLNSGTEHKLSTQYKSTWPSQNSPQNGYAGENRPRAKVESFNPYSGKNSTPQVI
jgi:hypothetical protein